MQSSNRPHVVVLPAFGMGHFIPMIELAKRLSAFHHFSVTCITADWQASPHVLSKYERRLSSNENIDIRFVQLPPVEVPAHITDVRQRVAAVQDAAVPLLQQTLVKLLECGPIHSFITDFFCGRFFDVALELQLPLYVFFVSPAFFLCLMLYAPTLSQTVGLPLKDPQRTIEVPGLPPLPAKDFPPPLFDESQWNWFRRHCYSLAKAHGFLVNTFSDLEKLPLTTLQEGKVTGMNGDAKEYYAVGPLIQSSLFEEERTENTQDEREECLRWLDTQPPKSVLYVSFGSRAVLSPEQTEELAQGLESSGQRFLWVLQKPQLPTALQEQEPKDSKSMLPEGFLDRTKGRGLVYTKWAPQVAILSHPSTGGFLSHCGWNSTLETIVCGVPVLTWPQGAEQRLIELLLVEEMKAGVSLRKEEGGIVKREEVERGAKELMTHEEVRENMKRLSDAANSAVAEGGSSFQSLGAVASVWKAKEK
eukprot:TRINITY_DN5760_c0_g3_i1.p1 TRINITY_DN5760_c0_g3~~TRINITY_DN5760_c0_g3_i1.p1  ORF type:complete len:476 (+),score=29.62 TRINITY_DN5760_c0_g3_i1:158-1585(+)